MGGRRVIDRVRAYPPDLAAATILAAGSAYVVVGLEIGSWPRVACAVALIGFLPGYAVTAALFPMRPTRLRSGAVRGVARRPGGIDTAERLGLAFALSLIVSVVVALVLSASNWGIDAEAAAGLLAGIAVVFAQIGAVRRGLLAPSDRYTLPSVTGVITGRQFVTGEGPTLSAVALVVAIVLAAATLGFTVLAPPAGDPYTEVSLHGPDGEDGFAVGSFPATVAPGDSVPYELSIENGEGQSMEYTVVVQEQRLEGTTVTEWIEHDRLEESVSAGETARVSGAVGPGPGASGDVRITFLVYEGSPPDTPTTRNADEYVYVWVTAGGT